MGNIYVSKQSSKINDHSITKLDNKDKYEMHNFNNSPSLY
jgi:hypothetical protein